MLQSIQAFFDRKMQADTQSDESDNALSIAAAALLIEVGRADFDFSQDEEDRVLASLRSSLAVSETELRELLVVAREQSEQSVSLHEFTRLIHEHYSAAQKRELMEQLWRVALTDGRIDRYEDYLLRKIADLIYLSHQEFIEAKLRAQA